MITCLWCAEAITPRELPWAVMGDGSEGEPLWRHQACALRQIVGSVAHQQGRCPCVGGTAGEDDTMSVRQAAEAALAYWCTHGRDA
jgi:hypothetical protein